VSDDAQLVPKQWIYAGRRIALRGAMVYAWADPEQGLEEKDLLLFNKVKAHAVGATYEVRVTDGAFHEPIHMSKTVKYLHDESVAQDRLDKWRLLDRSAEATKTQMQREAKARREGSDFGSLTLSEVRDMLNGPKAAGVLAQVLRYLRAA
jgi:hypothetical protein